MRYVLADKWSLTEHFLITDASGNPQYEVRGNLGLTQRLSFRDGRGQELAEIKKHVMTTTHEIIVGGQRAAEVRHTGFFGDHYDIDSSFGRLSAKGSFTGWNYSIDRGHEPVARVSRELALREKFLVDIADGVNDVFILAVVLAIDAIHDERRQEENQGGFGGGMGGGMLGGMLGGGNFP
jgi:uncharacterized protein YxjI